MGNVATVQCVVDSVVILSTVQVLALWEEREVGRGGGG